MELWKFDLPLEEDCFAPEENLERNSAGLKSSQTRGVWYKSLEENHSARIKEGSLLGHIMCSEEAQKKILESDIFHILEPEGVTEIGALYKVCPLKLFWSLGQKQRRRNLLVQRSNAVLTNLKYI